MLCYAFPSLVFLLKFLMNTVTAVADIKDSLTPQEK